MWFLCGIFENKYLAEIENFVKIVEKIGYIFYNMVDYAQQNNLMEV